MFSPRPSVTVLSCAPDFTLPDHAGNPVRLYSLLERGPVVLFFYPRDETLVCTLEACEFRDRYEAFRDAGATVVGVSDDSVERHRAFRDNHGLPFVLLSDRDGRARTLYGIKKTFGVLPGRVTFVIDSDGVVQNVFVSQLRALRHVEEALATLRTLRAPSQTAE